MTGAAKDPSRGTWVVIVALGVTQIIGWGSIFYSFSVLLEAVQQGLGTSRSVVVGAFSVAMLTAGTCAAGVGSVIDRIGGRWVMTCGSLGAGALLVVLGRVESVTALYLVWAGIGVAMSACLYEPAFAVITKAFGTGYRRAITALTLIAGFASTVAWPFSQWLLGQLGWRDTLLVLGVLNLVVAAPLHLLCLPRTVPPRLVEAGSARRSHSLGEVLRDPRFHWLAGSVICSALVFSSLSVHLIPLLQAKGLTAAAAAGVGALIGPMQVAGRVVEFAFARRVAPRRVGVVAMSILPLGMLALYAGGLEILPYLMFALLYGVANGVMTIVRGTIPVELFGRDHYGAVGGALSGIGMVAQASGPLVASLLWAGFGGYDAVVLTLAVVCVLGGVFFFQATRARPL